MMKYSAANWNDGVSVGRPITTVTTITTTTAAIGTTVDISVTGTVSATTIIPLPLNAKNNYAIMTSTTTGCDAAIATVN